MYKKIIVLIITCLCCPFLDARQMGVVEFSVNFIREKPKYTAELGNQALMGTVVEILDKKEYWLKIKTMEPYIGWVNEMGIISMDENELKDYIMQDKYICTSMYSTVYSSPSSASIPISDLVSGDILRVWKKNGKSVVLGGFYGVILPSGREGYVKRKDLHLFKSWAESLSPTMQNIVTTAMRYVGIPYMWGGASVKGFDCSGFIKQVWFMNGILLPRDSGPQSLCGDAVDAFTEDGKFNINRLKPADLLFFGIPASANNPEKVTHVGMYIGGGKFIHSSQIVRINSLSALSPDYYNRVPIKVRRYIGASNKSEIRNILDNPFYFPQEKQVKQ